MPTDVYFIGAERPLRLSDEYQDVTKQLQGRESGEFRRATSDTQITIYKNSIAFVADAKPGEVLTSWG